MKKLRQSGQPHGYLAGKSLGMIFQHPSTRTRVAFEAGMAQLGGQAIFLGVHDLQIKRGESLADTAQVLSRYVDSIVARVAAHSDIEEIAAASAVPVSTASPIGATQCRRSVTYSRCKKPSADSPGARSPISATATIWCIRCCSPAPRWA